MAGTSNFTERQAKYFASLRESLQTTTGKSLDEWVAIARTCPETKHRARLKWFKDQHGLLQNRASIVLDGAFGAETSWTRPDDLIDALWVSSASREIYEAIDIHALGLQGAIRTARKGYTAWSRAFQFASARPVRDGSVWLGLALAPGFSPLLEAPKSEPWSERLKSRLQVRSTEAVDPVVSNLLRSAWETS
jgi:hypothetical protein